MHGVGDGFSYRSSASAVPPLELESLRSFKSNQIKMAKILKWKLTQFVIQCLVCHMLGFEIDDRDLFLVFIYANCALPVYFR